MIDPHEPNDVIDVIDDARDGYGRQPLQIFFAAHAIARQLLVHGVAFLFIGSALNQRRNFSVNSFLLFAPAWFDMFGIEDHVHDATGFRQRKNHVVGKIARHVRNCATSRVRRNHRFGRGLDDVPKRGVGKMRNVYHHAKPIHFENHSFPKLIKSARFAHFIARRSRPTCADAPSRRHVTHTHLVIASDVIDFLVYRVATFEPHQRRDLSSRSDATNIGCGHRQLPRLRMFCRQRAHRLNL